MLIATPTLQLSTVDEATSPASPIQAGGQPVICPDGAVDSVVTLAASTSEATLTFPIGVTTAGFIFISALTATDLTVNIGEVEMPLPHRQGVVLYGLESADVSLSSVLGGEVRVIVGG